MTKIYDENFPELLDALYIVNGKSNVKVIYLDLMSFLIAIADDFYYPSDLPNE